MYRPLEQAAWMTSPRRVLAVCVVTAIGFTAFGSGATAQTETSNQIAVRVVVNGTPPPSFAPYLNANCSADGQAPFEDLHATFDAQGNPSPQILEVPTSANSNLCSVDFSFQDLQGIPPGTPYQARLHCAITDPSPSTDPQANPYCFVDTRPPFVKLGFPNRGGIVITVTRTFDFSAAPSNEPLTPALPILTQPSFTG